MPQARSFEQLVGIGRESSVNDGTTPNIGFPLTQLSGAPQISATIDQGRRGVGSRDFAATQDAGHGEFSIEGFAYPTEIGHFLMAMFGSLDSTAADTSNPASHEFSRGNNPPSYVIEDTVQEGADGALQYNGCRIGQLNFSYEAASGVLGYTSQWQGYKGNIVTPAAPTASPSDDPWQGWRAVVTSTDIAALVTQMELTIGRELEVVHVGEDSQDPLYINAGPMYAEAQATVVVETLDLINKYFDGVQQSMQLEFAYGTDADRRSITFLMTECFFAAQPIEIDRGNVSVYMRFGLQGLHNETDGGPIIVTLENDDDGTAYDAA